MALECQDRRKEADRLLRDEPGPYEAKTQSTATETGLPGPEIKMTMSRLRLAVFQTSARYTSKSAEEHFHVRCVNSLSFQA